MKIHIVKRGDTLSAIAKKYNTTVEALVASNGIKDKNTILVGQVIQIPEVAVVPAKDYEAIGKQVEAVLADVENLSSFKTLMEMV